jgi:hypothetical protein
MPVREQLQQVLEAEYSQLFFQKICPERTYSFQVFDGVGGYGSEMIYNFLHKNTNNENQNSSENNNICPA